MPTPNNQSARPLAPRKDQNLIHDCAELVEETCRYGSSLVDRLMREHSGGLDELAPLLLLRQTVETLDIIQAGLRVGLVDPLKLQLRSLIESCFYVLFILSPKKSLRSKSFLYFDAKEQAKRAKRGNPSQSEYTEYEKLRKKDRVLNVPMQVEKDQQTLDAITREHELGLNNPYYQDILNEINRLKAEAKKHGKKKRKFYWYELFDGCKSIQGLAEYVGLPAVYELFYRRYSGKIHPTDLIKGNVDILPDFSGFHIKPIRRGGNPKEIAGISCHISFLIYEAVILQYFSSEIQNVRDWYEKEIRKPYFAIND